MRFKLIVLSLILTACFSINSIGQSDSISVDAFYGEEIIDEADSSVSYYPLNIQIANLDTFDIRKVKVEIIHDSTEAIIRHVQFNPKADSTLVWEGSAFTRKIGFGGRENYTINLWFLDYGLMNAYSTQITLKDDQ